jgi:hypothetical protein
VVADCLCVAEATGAESRYREAEKECMAVFFVLKMFREHSYEELFSVVTDHPALVWLMSLRYPKHRLARWILEFQTCDFYIQHVPQDGSLMSVPDARSRDTMSTDLVLCANCLEAVANFEDVLAADGVSSRCVQLGVENLQAEQVKQFGSLKRMVGENGRFMVGEEGLLYRVFTENDIRIVKPNVVMSLCFS